MSCYKIVEETKEYKPSTRPCPLPLDADCGHLIFPAFYPCFNIGLDEPFAILMHLCEKCAKKATIETILTDERWDRMKAILIANGQPTPLRRKLKLQLLPAIHMPRDPRSYSYAMAA